MKGTIKPGEIRVINADNSDGPGTHWTAMKNVDGNTFIFDSFGVIPTDDVLNFADGDIYYNTYRIQDINSKLCGLFCIDFLENVFDYYSYSDWLLNYSPHDFKSNDSIVQSKVLLKNVLP